MVFDQATIPGVSNANVISFAVWVGDADTIDIYSYVAAPTNSGIKLAIVDNNGSLGATPSWTQFAPANADGSAGTFLSGGTPIFTPAISAADTVTTHALAAATTIKVNNSSLFLAGDYVKIGSGLSTAEVVQITAIPDGVTLTVTATNYAHNNGETVFTCARKIWLKVTVPVNATGGQALNLIDTELQRTYVRTAKP